MSQQLAGVETGNPQGTSVTTGSQQQTPSVTDTPQRQQRQKAQLKLLQ